jgi:hypothetical protein
MRTVQNWSDTQLLAYSKEHLYYEIDMFFRVGMQLSQSDWASQEPTVVASRNALIESFLIHLRNLLLFLYPYGAEDEDVISDDFFEKPIEDWKRKRTTESGTFREARARASHEVCHLTVSRQPLQKWLFAELMQELKPVLQIFVDNASTTRLDGAVKTMVESIDLNTKLYFLTDASTKSVAVGVAGATNSIHSASFSFPQPEKR